LQVPAPDVRSAIAKLDGEPPDEEPHRRDRDTLRRRQKDEGVDPKR
jgi:hypothetical protein